MNRDLEAALVMGDQRTRLFDEQNNPRSSDRMDKIKSIASRVMHHEFYKWFYVVISVLSIFALIIVQL